MNNRKQIAKDFAAKIKSDKIFQIILFGSVARGDDNEDSDIDILIISPFADEIDDEIGKVAVDFILETQEVIYAHVISVDHFNKTKDYPFLTNVLKDGVILG